MTARPLSWDSWKRIALCGRIPSGGDDDGTQRHPTVRVLRTAKRKTGRTGFVFADFIDVSGPLLAACRSPCPVIVVLVFMSFSSLLWVTSLPAVRTRTAPPATQHNLTFKRLTWNNKIVFLSIIADGYHWLGWLRFGPSWQTNFLPSINWSQILGIFYVMCNNY